MLFFRAKLMRKERKVLRFVPQKLRKSFANGNPKTETEPFFNKEIAPLSRTEIFLSQNYLQPNCLNVDNLNF